MADLNAQTEDDFEDEPWTHVPAIRVRDQRKRAAGASLGETLFKKKGMVWDSEDLSEYANADEPSSARCSCYSRAYYSARSRLFDYDAPNIAKALQDTSQPK
jgi:hypothetical protein